MSEFSAKEYFKEQLETKTEKECKEILKRFAESIHVQPEICYCEVCVALTKLGYKKERK